MTNAGCWASSRSRRTFVERLGGPVDRGGHEEAAGVLLGDGQEVLGREAALAVRPLGVAEPGGEDAGGDAGVVHGREQALDRGPLGQVGAEQLHDALLFVLGRPSARRRPPGRCSPRHRSPARPPWRRHAS